MICCITRNNIENFVVTDLKSVKVSYSKFIEEMDMLVVRT